MNSRNEKRLGSIDPGQRVRIGVEHPFEVRDGLVSSGGSFACRRMQPEDVGRYPPNHSVVAAGGAAARVVRLEQNYRSTARILDAANQVIAQNVRRKGKTLRTDAGPGEKLTRVEALDEADEAAWIVAEIEERLHQGASGTQGGAKSFRDFTVLYRTNAQSRALEEAMLRAKMPYQIVGGVRFFERREIMDLLAYLRLISNPRDAGAFDRIVNYPKRGIGDTSLAKLMSWAAAEGISPLEAAARARNVPELTAGAANALVAFADTIGRYRALSLHVGVGELIDRLLEDTGFILALQDEGPEGEDRIDNVKELLSDAHEFQELPPEAPDPEAENAEDLSSLDLYLQQVALLTDVDRHDPDADRVTLMTAHNAKGLEYPFVFIAGLEDGLFPLARAFDEPETLEEERRLFYVAITRARRKLYLLHARRRRRAGEVLAAIPSSFLSPIARELVEECPTPALARLRAQNEPTWKTATGLGSAGYTDGSYDRFGRRQRDVVPEQGSGRVIDYTDAQDAPRFIKGERVRHPAFGRGVIRELTGLGQETKAVIDFDSVGRKKVVLRYANLQKEL